MLVIVIVMVVVVMMVILGIFEILFNFQVFTRWSKRTAGHFNLDGWVVDLELLHQDFVYLTLANIGVVTGAANMGSSANFASWKSPDMEVVNLLDAGHL